MENEEGRSSKEEEGQAITKKTRESQRRRGEKLLLISLNGE